MVLDDKDQKLLLALERNARASVVDLARRIGLSRSATQERLGRLERSGVIAGYTIVRGAPTSTASVEAMLLVRHAPGSDCSRAVPKIEKFPEVQSVRALAGDPDLAIWVCASDTSALDQVAARVRSLPGIASVSTHVILASHVRA